MARQTGAPVVELSGLPGEEIAMVEAFESRMARMKVKDTKVETPGICQVPNLTKLLFWIKLPVYW